MANLKPLQCLNLDVNQQKNFINYFKSLSEKPVTTVRFFDRNDYYTMHGDDAELGAKIVFKSTSLIKTMEPSGSNESLKYILLSKGNFESLIRDLLLVKNYRVEVYTNKGSQRSQSEWHLEFKGSPGNLLQFEELLFSNNEMVTGSAIIGLQLKIESNQKTIGVACIEPNDRIFSVLEFCDDDFFAELEALIVLLGPKECLLPSIDGEFLRIKELMDRNCVMVTTRKKTDFAIEKSDLIQDLNKLLRFEKGQQESANTLPEITKTIAMSALGATIKYLDLISDNSNYGHLELKLLNLNRYVHLDGAAVSALNLFPKPGVNFNSPAFKWQSILGVLDRCRTPQGHRLLAQWLKQPLRNPAAIKDRHDIVECLVDGVNSRDELYDDLLKRLPDILMLTKKLMRKKASLQDIFRIYQVIIRMPKLVSILQELNNVAINNVILAPLKDTLSDLIMLKQMIEQVIDFDGLDKGEYFIKASFDEQLEELKTNMDAIYEKIEKQLSKAAKELELDEGTTIKLDTVSHLGYHFRIHLRDDAILRKNKKYKTLDTVKDSIRFTSEHLTDLNSDFTEAKTAYEDHQKTIVEEVVRIAVGYLAPLSCLNNQIAQIDVFVSFAVAAASAPIKYVRPTIYPEGHGILNLYKLRHPCLELQEDVQFIANDIIFKTDDTNMYIITGPNMGGKSTYIRSVGVAVLMAHVGSFVPCESADISIVDSILGRVGADDNLMKGLSTFMVEMIETSGIIRAATDKSLVIIDELGRGTSTYEGCGIAWSIAEHLAKVTKCFTLFATHFHEITELAQTASTVKNCHMVAIADNENFTLLYKVKPGIMDKSFGIHVAKLANFPLEVVDMAQKIYDESEDHYTQLKSEEDEIATNLFLTSIAKFTTVDTDSDAEIEAMINELKNNVKNCNSYYFKASFPFIFN